MKGYVLFDISRDYDFSQTLQVYKTLREVEDLMETKGNKTNFEIREIDLNPREKENV